MSPKKSTGKTSKGFTTEERAAMKDRVKELKSGEKEGESALLAKLATMQDSDRALGKRLHAIITAAAPGLSPTTWYGMPAYANDEGKIVCSFQSATKFKTRNATFGFS